MKLQEVNYQLVMEQKRRTKKRNINRLMLLVYDFLNTGYECAMVIDDEGHYNNYNDLNSTMINYLRNQKVNNVKVFMFNGNVYLRRVGNGTN